ncbi:AAA family ATPase [Intrasporangium sp.]|uniref:AAA family ATPase n=1 Tax=Intrasporangium sp. TaxID=1925024 RepID=UPI0032216A76
MTLPDTYVSADDYNEDGARIRSTWAPVDLSAALDGTWTPPAPSVGLRSDGVGLFYPGKAHTVSGESESLKTWFVLSAARDEITNGEHVVFVDFEDDAGPVVARLLLMGANPDRIGGLFHYVRPESPLSEGQGWADLEALLYDVRPSLAVVDGVTEGMTLHGLDPLSNRDAATFGRLLPRRLTAAGAAAVSLDHLTKSTETRGRYALGAVHKLNGLDGAAYVLEGRKAAGIGLVGRSTVRIAKDRPGQLRKHALPSSGGLHWFADVVLDATTEGLADIDVVAPEAHAPGGTDVRPTHLMAKISAVLADKGPLSQRQILALVGGKRDYAIKALTFLTIDGHVTEKTPHQLIKPYDEDGSK